MPSTLDQQLADLSAKLDRRDELVVTEIDVYHRLAEGNAQLTELDTDLASLASDLEELERSSLSKIIIGLISNKNADEVRAKREKQCEIKYGREDCDRKLETIRREFRGVQNEMDALDGIDAKFEPLARQKASELLESDPELAVQITDLSDAIMVNKQRVLILDEAVQCGAVALGTAKALAHSLIDTGKSQVKVRARGLAGLAFVAIASVRNDVVKARNVEPLQAMREGLQKLIKKVSSIPWNAEALVAPTGNAGTVQNQPMGQSASVSTLVSTLTRMHAVMDDEFAKEATGRPDVAGQIAAHIEPLLSLLVDRKMHEQEDMRTHGQQQRKLLETTPVLQEA